MKKIALTLVALVAMSAMAFAAEVDLDGKFDSKLASNVRNENGSIIADYPGSITVKANAKNSRIQQVTYWKRGEMIGKLAVGDEWNFHALVPASHHDFSYGRGDKVFQFFTENDGTATLYETENGRIISITKIAKSYYDTAKKYHNQKQLGLIK